jgi:hypothetical protein
MLVAKQARFERALHACLSANNVECAHPKCRHRRSTRFTQGGGLVPRMNAQHTSCAKRCSAHSRTQLTASVLGKALHVMDEAV